MDQKATEIYNKAIKYLTEHKEKYSKNVIEYVVRYHNYPQQNLTKTQVYQELDKYFNKRLVSVILQLISALNDDEKPSFPGWEAHLEALRLAKNN